MSPAASKSTLLAGLLEQPPGTRRPQDPDLAELLQIADQISEQWYAIEPDEQTLNRIFESAVAQSELRRQRRWRPQLPRIGGIQLGWTARIATGVAVIIAGVVAVNLLSTTQPGSNQILARAEAALNVQDKIIHNATEQSSTVTDSHGQAVTRITNTETWVYFTPNESLSHVVMKSATGELTSDSASRLSSNGVVKFELYSPVTNTVTEQYSAGAKFKYGGPSQAQDSLSGVRSAFKNKGTKVIGKTTVRGRSGYEIELHEGHGIKSTYVVDDKNYFPLETKTKAGDLTDATYYRQYELLDPTAENLALLKLNPHPGAEVNKEVKPPLESEK